MQQPLFQYHITNTQVQYRSRNKKCCSVSIVPVNAFGCMNHKFLPIWPIVQTQCLHYVNFAGRQPETFVRISCSFPEV